MLCEYELKAANSKCEMDATAHTIVARGTRRAHMVSVHQNPRSQCLVNTALPARGKHTVSVQIKTTDIPKTCQVCTTCEVALAQLIFMRVSDQRIYIYEMNDRSKTGV
jgi:hypothetical protein